MGEVTGEVKGGVADEGPAAAEGGRRTKACAHEGAHEDLKGVELVTRAAAFAARAHCRQRRKTTHEPYINHVLRVACGAAEAGLSAEAAAAAMLHDVVEDTRFTLEDLRERFPERVVRLVDLLTQRWEDDALREVKERERPKYYGAILGDEEAIDLKLLDRADNLRDMARMVPDARRWAESFLRRTEAELAPLYAASRNERARMVYATALAALRRALHH